MNDIENLYPNKYLKPADLDGKEVTFTIASVTVEEIGNPKERRAVLSFVGQMKRLVANKTNLTAISKLYGMKFAGMVGKSIVLYPTMTSFGGDLVPCIRIKAPPTAPTPASAPAAAPPAAPAAAARTAPKDEMDDEITF
jgi:hypothetical protein